MKKLISILLLCVFVLLCGCNNNTTKVPSTDNINLENKKYLTKDKLKLMKMMEKGSFTITDLSIVQIVGERL